MSLGARSMLQGRGRVAPAPSFASFTGCVGLVGLLLALASTAVAAAPPADVRLSARGIGPLVLGVPLVEASRQTVPLDPADRCDATMLAEVAALTSEAATAMADGRIDHIERGRIVKKARPVVQRLTAEIARHDREQAA